MLSICWSPKGGSGVTVTAAALALHHARRVDTLLVDLAGDLAPTLGVDATAPGTGDWLGRSEAPPEALRSLELTVTDRLRLLPAGSAAAVEVEPQRVALLLDLCSLAADVVVVDAGRMAVEPDWWPPPATSVVVVRNCYLGLRRLALLPLRPRSVIVIEEDGRALNRRDVAGISARPPTIVTWDPAVARAVDAGLLVDRLPRSLQRLASHV